MATKPFFLDERRLLDGPWQAFERDIARLLILLGFDDVRLVGGPGDQGGDVLGVREGELWVWQCKHTTTTPPPKDALREVVDAGRYYGAQRLVVAASRPAGDAFMAEKARYEKQGLRIEIVDPSTLLSLVAQAPEYPKSRRPLRDYQDEAVALFRNALIDTGRGQVVLATGLGKTIVMAEVVAELFRDNLIKENRVLVVAHTRELVEQLHRAFWYQLPKWVATHHLTGSETPTFWDGIVFATIQTVAGRLDTLPKFGLVLVDEAHHVGAQVFRDSIQGLDPKMLGGVTATPWRGDGYDIDQVLGPALVRIGIADGLQRGFLTEVDYRLYADNLDWEFVQEASKHHYSLSQLNKKLIIPTRDERAAQLVLELFRSDKRRGGIVYSPTIVHANSFAGMLRHFGLRAESISSESSPRERDLLLTKFRAGQLDFVVNVDLFNEGVDVPDADMIVFLRATHSRRIFVQQLGRGLRISPTKDRVIVLDFVSDLRRIAEVIDLDKAARGGDVERLGLGERLIQFNDRTAGNFLREWLLDQASLFLREDDPKLEVPEFDFPEPPPPGGVQ
jgi:superfamily II DNA or RNA helicase